MKIKKRVIKRLIIILCGCVILLIIAWKHNLLLPEKVTIELQKNDNPDSYAEIEFTIGERLHDISQVLFMNDIKFTTIENGHVVTISCFGKRARYEIVVSNGKLIRIDIEDGDGRGFVLPRNYY